MSSHCFSVPPVLAQQDLCNHIIWVITLAIQVINFSLKEDGNFSLMPIIQYHIFTLQSLNTIFHLVALAPITIQWLTSTIRMCYGCASVPVQFATVPKAPYDIIIHYKEWRYYRDQTTKSLKLTTKEENTYYHCMKTCVLNKPPGFTSSLLYIPPELITSLLPSHKLHIYDNFVICL